MDGIQVACQVSPEWSKAANQSAANVNKSQLNSDMFKAKNTTHAHAVPVFGLAVVLAATVLAPTAQAIDIHFDDGIGGSGGTVSYGGVDGTDPLVGANIKFSELVGNDTPLNSGVALTIVGGLLNFSTGANTSEGATVYTFGPGGTFTLTGKVVDSGNNVIANGTLLTGSFTGTSTVTGLGAGFGIFVGLGIDTKNQDLLNYYGITANDFVFANTEIGLAPGGATGNGGFSATVINADLNNAAVPDSGSTVMLLGAGLLGVTALARRRQN